MARVTAHEGYKSGMFSRIGSMTSSALGLSVTTGQGTAFFVPYHFPIGNVHHQWVKKLRTPTVTGPETKFDVNKHDEGQQ